MHFKGECVATLEKVTQANFVIGIACFESQRSIYIDFPTGF